MEVEMANEIIPVCEPSLLGNEKKYVLDAVESGWISSSGKYLKAFEELFAAFCGTKHGIGVCNGTVALHLALKAMGIGKGDEVIIPSFTMIASAFAVCYVGAMPVFVDAEPDTWNIDTARIEEKITKRTKAIMPVHIYGHPCDMEPITAIATKHGLKIIEDAAEVHGATYKGKKCGTLGDIAAFSFFANKIITTGEGGMVVTNDDELANKCRYYKNLCFPLTGERTFVHQDIGFNYRMSNVVAAIGLAQTENADRYVEMRRQNNALFRKQLAGVRGISFQQEKPWARNVYWMNGVIISPAQFGMTRDQLMKVLKENGVDSRLFFTGMHRQPSLKNYGCNCTEDYPVTDSLAANGMYLPSGSSLSEKQIDYVCDIIRRHARS
jgi:perosamine synthetase